MPYFKWKGITLEGVVVSGKTQAFCKQDLNQDLLHQNISLLQAHIKTSWMSRQISWKEKSYFFQQLYRLLQAGIFIDQALPIILHTIKHPLLKQSIQEILQEVDQGKSLAQAIDHQDHVFDAMACLLITSGCESGNIVQALNSLSEYLEVMYEFRKKVKQALLLPSITFLGFLCMCGFIIGFIVPLCAQTFSTMHHSTGWFLHILLKISPYFQGSFLGLSLCIILIIIYLLQKILVRMVNKSYNILFFLPGISYVLRIYITLQILSCLTLLLRNGVSLARSISIAQSQIYWQEYKVMLNQVYQDLLSGKTLSQSFAAYPWAFHYDTCALILLAEQAGTYSLMIERATTLQKERVIQMLHIISHIIQPLLIVVLGCALTLLIITIYYPILTGALSLGQMQHGF